MSERFFVTPSIVGDHAILDGPEAHHLVHVMRAKVGDVVTLFDGAGCEFAARIKAIGRSQIEVDVLQRREVNRESAAYLTLAVALPKGDRQKWLVEKAVELGVAALIPLETHRGVARPSEAALEKLRRAVIEASKQCGRNRLMEIRPSQSWEKFATAAPGEQLRLLAQPGATPLRNTLDPQPSGSLPKGILAAVGPEGGFTEQEIAVALTAGWIAVDLGPTILRVETAAIALAAWASQLG